jgi:hypothetical protein
MSAYALGIDLGTCFTAASVARETNSTPLNLGSRVAQMPSVVFIRESGEVLVGDAAEREAMGNPSLAARDFKRRLGDPIPITIGHTTHSVESLLGHLILDVVRRATEQERRSPTLVVLTHPANYSTFKIDSLCEAARLAGIAADRIVLLAEPQAAAVAFGNRAPTAHNEFMAVYNFGGATFEAAIVRRSGEQQELVGIGEASERLGGNDFDQVIYSHVDASLGGSVSKADRRDPQTRLRQLRLRLECRRAKESLSSEIEALIPVELQELDTDVRLSRSEFESLIRPRINETVRSLERAVESAGVAMEGVARVLLLGGTSRIPLVADMVGRATSRPISLDPYPKLSISIGASLYGAARLPEPEAVEPLELQSPALPNQSSAAVQALLAAVPRERSRRRRRVAANIALVALVIGGTAVALTRLLGSDSTNDNGTDANSPTTVTVVASSTTTAITKPISTTTTAETTPPTVVPGRGVTSVVDHFAFDPAASPGDGLPGAALKAGVSGIAAVTVDSGGAVFVATTDGTILRINKDLVSIVSRLASNNGQPGGIAVAADGTVLVSVNAGVVAVRKGVESLFLNGAEASLGTQPGPIALDASSNLYVADNARHRIVRRGSDGVITVIAGNGTAPDPAPFTGELQPATSVAIGSVVSLAVDAAGNIIFADADSHAVRAVATNGVIVTVAGGGVTPLQIAGSFVAEGTKATIVKFATIEGITVAPSGQVYIADSTDGAIVRVSASGGIEVILARRLDIGPANGVPAQQSSVSTLGVLALGGEADLFFADAERLRVIRNVN